MTMNRKTLTMLAVATASVIATPSHAADFYAGLNAGWSATDTEIKYRSKSEASPGNIIETTQLGADSIAGLAFGGVAGVKLSIPTGFIALEANLSDSSADSEADLQYNGTEIGYEKKSNGLSYGITGIVAYEMMPGAHLYGLAGYQMLDIDLEYGDRNTANNDIASDSIKETFGGARFGAGIENKITDALSLRMEWSHTLYSEEKVVSKSARTVDGITNGIKPTETRITFGLIGHF